MIWKIHIITERGEKVSRNCFITVPQRFFSSPCSVLSILTPDLLELESCQECKKSVELCSSFTKLANVHKDLKKDHRIHLSFELRTIKLKSDQWGKPKNRLGGGRRTEEQFFNSFDKRITKASRPAREKTNNCFSSTGANVNNLLFWCISLIS